MSDSPQVSTPWDEQWFHGLESASQRWFAHRDFQGMKEILEPLHETIEQSPQTPANTDFAHHFGDKLKVARALIARSTASDEDALQEAWDIYYSVFQRIYKDIRARGVVLATLPTNLA